jgi:hypothetical protein
MEPEMTLPTHPLDLIPLWAVLVLTIAFLFLATEVGFQAGKAWHRRHPEVDSITGPMVAATLGLVGFLLAFMVSLAADRYNVRRGLALEEANVIGTAYLRAGYLPEPHPGQSRDLLREYVDVRLEPFETGDFEAALARSEEIQKELWLGAEDLVIATGGSDVYALYIESLNEIFVLHAQREIAGFYARLSPTLVLTLFGLTLMGMFILGFGNSGDGKRGAIALVTLIFVFGCVLYLIMDLDRSQEGLFQVSQQPMIGLQERLNLISRGGCPVRLAVAAGWRRYLL